MEKTKNYGKNRIHECKIRYISQGSEEIYTRKPYTEFGKEKFKWIDQKGMLAPEKLIPLFESVASNSQLKSNKLEATILQMKIEE